MQEIIIISEILLNFELKQDLAAITGIQGVSSSLWLPINQSTSGNKFDSDGDIAICC